MNAHCERFNRTIQEQFVDYHADLLFTDLALFNRKMAAWLVEYNTVIPHHSLGLQTPIQFGFQQLPQCQRYWTHTPACHILCRCDILSRPSDAAASENRHGARKDKMDGRAVDI